MPRHVRRLEIGRVVRDEDVQQRQPEALGLRLGQFEWVRAENGVRRPKDHQARAAPRARVGT